jgi:hypothetical protein
MNTETILAIWSLLGTVAGALVIIAAALWASKTILLQARALWQTVRGDVISAVDEPTDPLNRALERLSSVPAGLWAAFLPAFFEALAAGLDAVLIDLPDDGSAV